MENKNLIRFLGSFILLPVITVSMPAGSFERNIETSSPVAVIRTVPQPIVLLPKENIETSGVLAFAQAEEKRVEILKAQAEAIDAYFKKYDMPLSGTGMKMAEEAQKNGLDWRLLPAIAVIESTGGKAACKKVSHSFFGWGSCKINFSSKEKAIEVVAWNLGGNNPNTKRHYGGKTTKEMLQKYNPPSIVPDYADKVMKVMEEIGKSDIAIKEAENT